jgi:hypothetical protein
MKCEKVPTRQARFIENQIVLLNKPRQFSFSFEDISNALSFYSKSRTLYEILTQHLVLPSVRHLQRMTSRVNKLEDISYLKIMFNDLEDAQKFCFILIDEVYVKPGLQFSGGTSPTLCMCCIRFF